MHNPPTAPEYQHPDDYRGSPYLQVQRVLVGWLQGLFAQCPAGAYHWEEESNEPDASASEIHISTDNPIMVGKVGQRPAITVLRSMGTFNGVGMGDMAYTDWTTGATVRMDILPCTYIINVLSRFPVEAETLAWFTLNSIWALRDEIIKSEKCLLYFGNRPTCSPPSPAGSLIGDDTEHNWTVVSVMFPAYLQWSATTMPLNQRIVGGITPQFRTTEAAPALPPEGSDG